MHRKPSPLIRLSAFSWRFLLVLLAYSFAAGAAPPVTVHASTSAAGGINVEPAARPWQYVGANPDGWWCPSASACTTSNPLGRIDTEMALAQQLHVANIRIEIPWFLVEPSNGGYNWTRADYIFSSAAGHGIVLQPILVYTPAWDGGYNAFPHPADFGAFVSAFMGRYGSRINAVEMWNEPDGGQSLVANNPAQYVQDILIPGYNAVKASPYPGVRVIEGGSINDSGVCCPWLSGIYAAGGGSYFDIAAFHDYGGNYGSVVQAYRGVLSAHGQGGKPIWMGEYGVSDSTGSQQSSLINAALTATPGLAMAQFYTLRDESVYTCCPPAATGEHKQYGVVAADDVTKKSSFYTMQSLLGGSSPPPPPPPPSSAPPQSSPTPTSDNPAPASVRPSTPANPTPANGKKPGKPTPSSSTSLNSTGTSGGGYGSAGGGTEPPASAVQSFVSNHQGGAVALEALLAVVALLGLGLAASGVALVGDVPVLGRFRVAARLGQGRSAVGVGVVAIGLFIAVAAVVFLPIR